MQQQELITQAIKEYTNNNLALSEQLFRQILSMEPNNAQALYFLGIIAFSKGILDEACQLLYKATVIEPKNKDYIYSLAVVLQEDGKIDEAIDLYKKLPDFAEGWNNLANIYMAQKDFKQALTCFDKALSINPKMVWAKVNKSIMLRLEGDVKEAVKLLLNALEDDENFVPALYQLSICYRAQNKVKEALDVIQSALKNKDVPDFVYVEYGKVLSCQNRTNEALEAFESAIKINRFCEDAYFEKARLLEKENPSDAEEAYRTLIRINPSCEAAYNNLGTLLYNQGRVNEALEMYRQVVILNPKDMLASFNLAIALEDLEEYAEATGVYFNVLSHHRFEEQTHIRLSSVLPKLFEKDKELALRYAEGWVKNFPDNPLALHVFSALSGKEDTVDNDLKYTQNLYDAFADTYEEKMKELSCQIPEKIANLVKKEHYKNVLDLGCGTGLGGIALRPLSDHLTGIDISDNMLKKAKEKNVYDSLLCSSIEDFLTKCKKKYNLIVAADVFCYIYDLKDILSKIYDILSKNGVLVFTIEKAQEATGIIPQGRYQHNPLDIENMLKDANFKKIECKELSLRKEGDAFCKGCVITASK